jgi:hypothetical protein
MIPTRVSPSGSNTTRIRVLAQYHPNIMRKWTYPMHGSDSADLCRIINLFISASLRQLSFLFLGFRHSALPFVVPFEYLQVLMNPEFVELLMQLVSYSNCWRSCSELVWKESFRKRSRSSTAKTWIETGAKGAASGKSQSLWFYVWSSFVNIFDWLQYCWVWFHLCHVFIIKFSRFIQNSLHSL